MTRYYCNKCVLSVIEICFRWKQSCVCFPICRALDVTSVHMLTRPCAWQLTRIASVTTFSFNLWLKISCREAKAFGSGGNGEGETSSLKFLEEGRPFEGLHQQLHETNCCDGPDEARLRHQADYGVHWSQECCDGAKLQQTPGENETGGKEDRVSLIDQLREEQVTWCCWSWEQPWAGLVWFFPQFDTVTSAAGEEECRRQDHQRQPGNLDGYCYFQEPYVNCLNIAHFLDKWCKSS